MHRIIVGAALVAASLAATVWAQKPPAPARSATPAPAKGAPPAKGPRDADEKAIRAAAEAFGKAYNTHDAKSIGLLFAPEGEIVNEEGHITQGRAAIEKVFAAGFAETPETQMVIEVKAIRFLGPTVAVEDGTSTVIEAPETPGERSRYTALHVKQPDGKWLMASARDLTDEPTEEEQLKQLEWMIGDWVDESPDSVIVTTTRWADNHHFILSKFTVQIAGRPALSGTQRIGWDPLDKIVRSWVFDSEGGFAEGVYSHHGNQWIVKLTGVTRDGKMASATNTTTIVSRDRLTWQSRDRIVGGEAQPDSEEMTVVRRPPKPLKDGKEVKETPDAAAN